MEPLDLSSTAAQQYIYDKCQELKANRSLSYDAPNTVRCVFDDFKTYKEQNGGTFPVAYADKAAFDADMSAFLLTSVGQAYTANNDVGYIGTELRYIRVLIFSPTKLWLSRSDGLPYRDAWVNFVKATNNGRPAGLTTCLQTALLGDWCWYELEQALIDGAFLGIAIALPAAFVSLLIFTLNWMVSLYAVLSITGVMTSVSLFTLAVGWDFGVIESLAVVIVIGFSVDYNVHLGHAYLEGIEHSDSKSRSRFALLTMGISVVSGAVTTVLAGAPSLLSSLIFLSRMGLIIVVTIIFALLWSLLAFMSVMIKFGPHGTQGDLHWMCPTWCPCSHEEAHQTEEEKTAHHLELTTADKGVMEP